MDEPIPGQKESVAEVKVAAGCSVTSHRVTMATVDESLVLWCDLVQGDKFDLDLLTEVNATLGCLEVLAGIYQLAGEVI